ncbi:FadR/GntR family transcriptional regulator [Clostridium estertheticum]|uniref:GntR family transcriptional regulator n=1 Tax=Clostridium estertheticum subsp. estertheticum TaxID=1552 RepID=A0A1J0GET5_9CLOT|nr:FadR/GntR family transcriptional regulator [Clostridium estertheticum]APC39881.1 GntR family transcriptional regulator [Clostridium estertheticum subsp. estertheticum]MBU3184941.1 FadR family transcriptional regulator [Clostridium estertheticum]MBZ9614061.1 FadR family transcriptional regulator [Clostridium estertheticum subsp. laramiense]MCB2340171.1 FadR family transcriptional regulator [Clostridium estertheticum]WAG74013.1 FadR family transcriptional regulator [Clostridium estertheticum]
MKDTRTSDRVFNVIQEKIISGEYKPGMKIMSELKLAEELQVSRVSVREAIEKMSAVNIVSKRRGGGTFVNDLKPSVYLNSLIPMITLGQDNYNDILEFRLIIESEASGLCAQRCSDDLVNEIEECYNNMIKYQDDFEKFTEEDLNFHMKIVEGSNSPLIIKVNEILKNLLRAHQKLLYNNLGPSGGLSEHKLILEAIKNRDSQLAKLFAKRHIERTIRDIKK